MIDILLLPLCVCLWPKKGRKRRGNHIRSMKSHPALTLTPSRAEQEERFPPYIASALNNYSCVERDEGPYPTYDMWLNHNETNQIVSDCQGTFKTYENLNEILPLLKESTDL